MIYLKHGVREGRSEVIRWILSHQLFKKVNPNNFFIWRSLYLLSSKDRNRLKRQQAVKQMVDALFSVDIFASYFFIHRQV